MCVANTSCLHIVGCHKCTVVNRGALRQTAMSYRPRHTDVFGIVAGSRRECMPSK